MALIRQGGSGSVPGKVNTTMGMRDRRAPVCNTCRERKAGQIYSRTANGEFICYDCASPRQREMIGEPVPDEA